MNLLRQVIESPSAILLYLTFAYPERFALAAMAAHAQTKKWLPSLGPLELNYGIHQVIITTHLNAQGVLYEGAPRNFQALGRRSI